MTAAPCGWCGYSRAVPVAGCDHATVPAAGEERCGDRGSSLEVCQLPKGHDGLHECDPYSWGSVANLSVEEQSGLYRTAFESAEERAQEAEAALATEREKGNLLAAELVDLQRKLVATEDALEQARRESGRLRAELEMAQAVRGEEP